MNREIGITSRHFDRSEASLELKENVAKIFENPIFISKLKVFSAMLEMTRTT